VNDVAGRMDLFASNADKFGHNYYFPYNISILLHSISGMRIPFFSESGAICGLYHEPHIITFMTFPALFILLSKLTSHWQKGVIIGLYVLIMLLATSTTNIVTFFVCVLVLLFRRRSMNLIFSLLIIIITIWIILYSINIDLSDFMFISEKMESGSKDYSQKTILFAFTPKTLLGSNFMQNDYLDAISSNSRDVGYISFILNIIFLLIFSYKIIRLIFTKNNMSSMVGIAILYFFLHSMKVAMVAYSLSFLMFAMFLLTIYDKTHKRLSFNDVMKGSD
jgi:hypothetical protein